MTAIDTAKAVLAKASLFDQTFANPDLGIAVAWSEALGNIDMDDALIVVTSHYTSQTRRIMPADVIAGVHKIRSERITRDFEDVPELDAVADDPIVYKARLIAHRRRVGSGWQPPPPAKPLTSRPVAELLQAAVESLPKVPEIGPGDVSMPRRRGKRPSRAS